MSISRFQYAMMESDNLDFIKYQPDHILSEQTAMNNVHAHHQSVHFDDDPSYNSYFNPKYYYG